jgi:hypothetical protein
MRNAAFYHPYESFKTFRTNLAWFSNRGGGDLKNESKAQAVW